MTLGEREWTAVADEIKAAHQQFSACEREFDYMTEHDSDEYEAERSYLGFRIRQAHLSLSILLERAGLPAFHQQYLTHFARFGDDLDKVNQIRNEPWALYSLPLQFVEQTYEAARKMLRGDDDRTYSAMQLFISILRQTAHLLYDRNIEPTSENEVRNVVYDTLKIVFPDTLREVPVAHIFKTFRGDIGVPSLKVLTEVKYANSEQELKAQLDGIYADMRGYSGDPQWERFFALIYTTKAIASQARIFEAFKHAEADANWTPIVVVGAGSRERKPRKKKETGIIVPEAGETAASTDS